MFKENKEAEKRNSHHVYARIARQLHASEKAREYGKPEQSVVVQTIMS